MLSAAWSTTGDIAALRGTTATREERVLTQATSLVHAGGAGTTEALLALAAMEISRGLLALAANCFSSSPQRIPHHCAAASNGQGGHAGGANPC